MKGNTKRLAVLVIITVIATFMMAATVTAEWRKHRFIQAQYAATGSGTCLVAPFGFDGTLVPKSEVLGGPSRYMLMTFTMEGVFTFHRDGTGHIVRPTAPTVLHSLSLPPPPPPPLVVPPPPPYPSALDSEDSLDFTYEVGHDGSITLTQVPGSHSGSFTSGPMAGFSYANENRNWWGTVSPDGKTIILNSGFPDIITSDDSVEGIICNGSAVLIWQHDIRWGWKHDRD
jgi:hypothetical protein